MSFLFSVIAAAAFAAWIGPSPPPGEAAIIFDHQGAQNVEGASIFWIRRLGAIGGEQVAVEHWQIKRDKTLRGIVEVISDDSKQ